MADPVTLSTLAIGALGVGAGVAASKLTQSKPAGAQPLSPAAAPAPPAAPVIGEQIAPTRPGRSSSNPTFLGFGAAAGASNSSNKTLLGQ